MPEVIFDSCVLSNFALSDGIWILKRLYAGKAYITDFVGLEIVRGIYSGHERLSEISLARKEKWLKETVLKTRKEKALFEKLSASLGAGEASCIAVARNKGYVFASDDRVARQEAILLNVAVTGTIGILLRAAKRNFINADEGDNLLTKMIETGFYSPITSFEKFVDSD